MKIGTLERFSAPKEAFSILILTLSRMHRSKESLDHHGKIRREIPARLSAAQAYFDSWGKALYAAGIDRIYILCITSGGNVE
jgi:hypothetical protein